MSTQLTKYIELIQIYGNKFNLVSRAGMEHLDRFVDESLEFQQHLSGNRIIDLGSGAGFPGIPLAIYNPTKQFVLVEATQKKAKYLQIVVETLQLDNTEIVNESLQRNSEPLFSNRATTVVTRAFGPIEKFFSIARPQVSAKQGMIVTTKGPHQIDEVEKFKLKHPKLTLDTIPKQKDSSFFVKIYTPYTS